MANAGVSLQRSRKRDYPSQKQKRRSAWIGVSLDISDGPGRNRTAQATAQFPHRQPGILLVPLRTGSQWNKLQMAA
jgi:hypothetical protein